MNEEQAALEFFSRRENLPLALIAAEHLDALRRDLNNAFWQGLAQRLDALLAERALPWSCALTEDRNREDCLVGVHLQPTSGLRVFLRPFMEQQFIGDGYRIYYGLMWNTQPDSTQKNLPAISQLSQTLQQAGFKQGDDFFAWQWLPWHPRRRDFLMRFGSQPEDFLEEAMQPWQDLLQAWGPLLQAANAELAHSAASATISLESLRSKLPQRTGSS